MDQGTGDLLAAAKFLHSQGISTALLERTNTVFHMEAAQTKNRDARFAP
jgi:hypothetical protein